VGRMVTRRMSPMNLALGEAGEGARRGHRPETSMAFFIRPLGFRPADARRAARAASRAECIIGLVWDLLLNWAV